MNAPQSGWIIWSKIAGWTLWIYFIAASMRTNRGGDAIFIWMCIFGISYFVAYRQGCESRQPKP